jgi:hypothetical protein
MAISRGGAEGMMVGGGDGGGGEEWPRRRATGRTRHAVRGVGKLKSCRVFQTPEARTGQRLFETLEKTSESNPS